MILGIDLGTTKSVVGIWQNQAPCIIPDKAGHQNIPSLILVTPKGKIFAGNMAKNHPERYKGKNITIGSVKRLLGKRGETKWGWWKTYPQEVSAFILTELKNQAERYLGHEVNRAVIAIPSHFDDSQRRATKEAAEIAGLEVVRLLNEATAAAITYGIHRQAEETVAVFDFGGGTLDVSIVDFGEGVFEVKCIEGDSNLGGDDFDQVIVDYILDHVQEQCGATTELDTIQYTMLREIAETAKIELSSRQKTSVHVPGFLHSEGRHYDLDISIDRQTFEELSKPLFDRATALVKKALQTADMRASDLSALLLLGGSSRIPYMRESIKRELNVEPVTGVDLETCVAQGAVIQAAALEGKLKDVLLLDVLPNSYGIRSKGDAFSRLIKKNTPVGTRRSQIFSTAEDNQSRVPIEIYQGENEIASKNTYLGTFELTDIPPAPAGVPKIEVTFDVDVNMIINISARDLGTGKECSMKVRSPYGLNSTQIRAMKQKIASWLSEQQTAEIKTHTRAVRALIDDMLTKDTDALDWEDISTLRKTTAVLDGIMKEEILNEELENTVFAVQSLYEKMYQKVTLYTKVTSRIKTLMAKIEKITPVLKPCREKEALLLSQGGNLLKKYLEQKSSYEELHNILSSVRSGYEEAVADLIVQAINDLTLSKGMEKWVKEIGNGGFLPSLIYQNLQSLKKIEKVDFIVTLLESEDLEYRKSIQQKILRRFEGDFCTRTYLLLIVSAFIDFHVLSMIEEIDQKIDTILAFALFSGLCSNSIGQRREVAQIIAQYMPIQYLSEVVDYFCRESDTTVRRYLLGYVDRHPPGTLAEFFLNADHDTKMKVSNNKEMLLKLASEPNEEVSLSALDLWLSFQLKKLYLFFSILQVTKTLLYGSEVCSFSINLRSEMRE